MQAWRKHCAREHNTVFTSPAFASAMREPTICSPCRFCGLALTKTPALHRAKCLPLAQLALYITHHGGRGSRDHEHLGSHGIGGPAGDSGQHSGEPVQVPAQLREGGTPPQGRKKGAPAAERSEGSRSSRPDSLLTSLAALTLRHEAQLQMLEVDRSYVLFLNTEPLGVIPLVREANERWKHLKEANKVTASLRCTLLTSVLLELQTRVQKVEAEPVTRKKCEEGGWCSTGGEEGLRWYYKRWDPVAKEAKAVDGEGLSQAELLANLSLLIQHSKQDGVLHRFHSLRPLAAESTAENVTVLMTISTRTAGEAVHQALAKLQDLCALSLIGARLRPERMKSSPLAEEICKMTRQGAQE